jgi:hypothetical protein
VITGLKEGFVILNPTPLTSLSPRILITVNKKIKKSNKSYTRKKEEKLPETRFLIRNKNSKLMQAKEKFLIRKSTKVIFK